MGFELQATNVGEMIPRPYMQITTLDLLSSKYNNRNRGPWITFIFIIVRLQ